MIMLKKGHAQERVVNDPNIRQRNDEELYEKSNCIHSLN